MEFQVPALLNSNSSSGTVSYDQNNKEQVTDRITVSSVQMGSEELLDIQRPDFFQNHKQPAKRTKKKKARADGPKEAYAECAELL